MRRLIGIQRLVDDAEEQGIALETIFVDPRNVHTVAIPDADEPEGDD
jgi:hypothetical protein